MESLKTQRQNTIRELVSGAAVQNQDELRRKLRRHGFAVTQATLSRDLHDLRLFKGPSGYSLPQRNGNGHRSSASSTEDDSPPSVPEVMESFGLRVAHAMNQVVVRTVMGGAQPVAAALDYEEWPEVVGTIAGDDTVLIICHDTRKAALLETKIKKMLDA
jgi:transcriptional regulator of arginine metabolism